MKQINLPKDVSYIIENLDKAGYEAYAVGGCVRDTLLGRVPGDWDITTSASPLQVKELFPKTIDTGLQHGTVTVMMHHVGYEVTTYRIDGEYQDGRHPKNVIFTNNLIEDLKRRDFTINAMAYNDKSKIVDEFDGIGDLEKKLIRCVGEPAERFGEDALRMLRAVRFAAQLGFSIEEHTEEAIYKLADTLKKISRERVQSELNKLLISDYPECICKVYETGLSDYALLFTEQFKQKEIQEKIVAMLKILPPDSILRWSAFLSFCEEREEFGKTILKDLKFDNHTIEYVSKLVYYLPKEIEPEEIKIRFGIYEMGEELYPLYLKLKQAELEAQSQLQKEKQDEFLKERQEKLKENKKIYLKILERGDCLSLKNLAVTGADLIEIGIPAGKEMGRVLRELLFFVLEYPEGNERECLLEKALEKIDREKRKK